MLTIVAAGATVYKMVSNNININNGNSISIKTKNGSSLSIGNSVNLPSGFPSDVPIYKPSEIKAAANDKKDTYGITLVANANFSTVDSYYNTQLQNQGWQADPNNTGYSYDKSKLASYTKGGKTLRHSYDCKCSGYSDKHSNNCESNTKYGKYRIVCIYLKNK
jgi:hypothetical protein